VSAKRTTKPSRRVEAPQGGRADLSRLQRMTEREIERTSPPELADLPDDFWTEADVVAPLKQAVSLRVDQDVLEWFRAQGPRYQTRMNAVLRSYVSQAKRTRSERIARPKSRRLRIRSTR
jgi:uncharacterized protein (DUF4415 family)